MKVEVNSVMIELHSMTGQSQEIDLNIRRLDNSSIVKKKKKKKKKKSHIRMNCRYWKKEQTKDKDQKDTTTVMDDEEVVVLLVQKQKCEHVDNNDDECVIDSAATHCVVRTKELFTTHKAGGFATIKMGTTSYPKIVGIGDVCIKTNVGCTVMLKNVQHVLDLCFNLISTPAMDRVGYCNHLDKGRWKLTKGPLVVAIGCICCGLYSTRVKTCKKKFNAVETVTQIST